MSSQPQPGYQDPTATLLGYILFGAFVVLFFNIINLPRTPIDQRAPLQLMHDTLGLLVGVLACVRLWWFFKGPAPQPPVGMPPASFAFGRAILFALVLTFAVEFILGFGFAWGEGRDVKPFGWQVPQLLEKTEGLRKTSGYLHSALAFYYLMLISLWLALGIWQQVRYGAGWRRLLPGARV